MLRALRDTAFLFGLRPADAVALASRSDSSSGQDAIASPLSSNAQQCSA